MVIVNSVTKELGYYIAPDIYEELMRAKEKVEHGLDRVYCIDGREGLGKSTLGIQLAYAVDRKFTDDNIGFSGMQFEKLARRVPKQSAIIFDEAFNGLSSKGALTYENKRLVRLLMEVRQRQLFIFLILPSIFMLEKYCAILRTQALFHVRDYQKNYKLRYYKRYNYHNKKQLYLKGVKTLSYYYPKIIHKYNFFKKYPAGFDVDTYLKRKEEAFKATHHKMEQEHKLITRLKGGLNLSWYLFNKKYNMNHTEIAKMYTESGYPVHRSTVTKGIRPLESGE